jgi:hypothetical protein
MFFCKNGLTGELLLPESNRAGPLAASACPLFLAPPVTTLTGRDRSSGLSQPPRPWTPEPGALAAGSGTQPVVTGFGMETAPSPYEEIQG